MTNACMSSIRAPMPSMPWPCVMPTYHSQTWCADGMGLYMIQPYSIQHAPCTPGRWRWKKWLAAGDRGYGIQPYLMTPFRPDDVSTPPQRYQKAHTKTRNTIERAFGLWKARFRCFDASGGALQFDPSRCCTIITATAVLHNMCILDNTPLLGYVEHPLMSQTR